MSTCDFEITFKRWYFGCWEWIVGDRGWDPDTERYTYGTAWTERGAKRKAERFMKARRKFERGQAGCPIE